MSKVLEALKMFFVFLGWATAIVLVFLAIFGIVFGYMWLMLSSLEWFGVLWGFIADVVFTIVAVAIFFTIDYIRL
ncbi:hypothetical protein NNG48_07085 [Enterococcus faecium]|nr:hypothetical protein [Enterococcus faecium]